MNPTLFYTQLGSLSLANLVRTGLAGLTLHLYQLNDVLGVSTTQAHLVTGEATFDGYAAIVVAAWLTAYFDPAGGSSFQSGTQQFDFVHSTGVANTIYAFWLEDTSTPPNLYLIGTLPSGVPMAANGNALPVNVLLNFGAPV